jgi:hypothetical protein
MDSKTIALMCAFYKAYNDEMVWKDIGDRLKAPYYRSRVDNFWKIRARKIRTDVGKFSFINGTIADWNRLPEGAIGNARIFRKRVREVIIRELKYGDLNEMKCGYIVGTEQRATCLHFLLFLLFSYVLLFYYVFLFSLFSIMSPYVLLFSFCPLVFFGVLFILYITPSLDISAIAIINK